MSRMFPSLLSWQKLAGNRRLFLFCFLLFAISAFFSFWMFFPADVLQRRLIHEVSQQTGLKMEGRNAAMLFPVGLELDLSIYPAVPEMTDLELTELQVTPLWSRLFSSDRGVKLTANVAGGQLDIDAGQSGQVNCKFNNIALEPLQKLDMPYRISGQLTGVLDGENLSENMTGRGDFAFRLNATHLLGLERIGLPANFSVGVLRFEGKFDQRRFSLEKVVLTGGAIELSGGGNILVGETPEQTRLNLNVRLHPTASTPDSLGSLLNITGVRPTADGSYLLRIGGTLAKPAIR
ncbi:MAG: type II secretion system protein GspN [Thermodesulfobacteriota bacterium]|nr:type II secretion system protein GspN [Thermodesulfobacteriota bacterium]